MKNFDLGQSLTILANIGVIAGIVILVIEMRESNRQARVTIQTDYSSRIYEWYSEVASDSESAEIYRRGLDSFDALSELEQTKFDLIIRSYLGRLITAMAAVSEGLGFSGSGFESRQFEVLLEREGFREWWEEVDRRTLPLPLVQQLERADAVAN